MHFLGNNHVYCYVWDGTQGDFCGGSTPYPAYPNYTWGDYSGGILPIYRFWSDTNRRHFFTIDHGEKVYVDNSFTDTQWKYESIGFFAFRNEVCIGSQVYRFWSDTNKGHFYTISEAEKNFVIANYPPSQWRYEGVGFCALLGGGSGAYPVYRFWSSTNKGHFYTIDEGEKNHIIASYPSHQWAYEGVAFYAYK